MERRSKLAAVQLFLIIRRRQALSRKQWVRPVWTKRADESEYFTAMKLMKNGDDSLFKFYRMSLETFDALHNMVWDRTVEGMGLQGAYFAIPVVRHARPRCSYGLKSGAGDCTGGDTPKVQCAVGGVVPYVHEGVHKIFS
ncbi:hypothetical protein HPB49_010405 [Dermacentor silvarum]|uniref:Uncharacterized protein n=1 Tax=Dermacentor silvarum TaxID=543639 RepID=A0ACB8C8T0_DERSI|nr:hypothetical protein HPB49_010405 [Dermacentor silvarum]